MTEFLAYEMFRPVSAWAGVVLCRNPGVMRLAGTNSWVLRAPGRTDCVIVDPGPRWHRRHLRVLAAQGKIALVLLTHHHPDHAGAASALHKLSRAPVRAWHSSECRGADPLSEGEVIESAGFRITVMYTPGHTSDSVSFVVHHGSEGAVITGDTVLGLGSTVLAPAAGALSAYLDSLHDLVGLGSGYTLLPGHGPEHRDALPLFTSCRLHRYDRIARVRDVLIERGTRPSETPPLTILPKVCADTDVKFWPAAYLSLRAQLSYLSEQGW